VDALVRVAYRRLKRFAGVVRAAIVFRKCRRGQLVNVQGHVKIVAEGEVRLGDRVEFEEGPIPTALIARRGAELAIGSGTSLAHAAHIEAWRSVRIGQRCLIAPLVCICDHDADGVAPIVIDDDVWLAHGVTVEPGVRIGAGSVVSAGSVVRHDVPPHSLAAGAPASSVPLAAVAPKSARGTRPQD
jgi:UDP-3-O-[3-hydroxymyristoyl] glucosamine N-acyltransferase